MKKDFLSFNLIILIGPARVPIEVKKERNEKIE